MLSFKEYLTEAEDKPYNKVTASYEDAEYLLLNKCCQFLATNPEQPIIRGSWTSTNDSYIVHGETGKRSSRNTSNYYTVILDKFLSPLGYPKRSQSIICGNYKNMTHVGEYGHVYALIPFDNTKIGVCPGEDIFDTVLNLFGARVRINGWNILFESKKLPDDNYNKFIDELFRLISSDKFKASTIPSDERIVEYIISRGIDTKQKLEHHFEEAYTSPFKLINVDEVNIINDVPRELWIGGKCVQIRLDLYNEFLKDHKINKS